MPEIKAKFWIRTSGILENPQCWNVNEPISDVLRLFRAALRVLSRFSRVLGSSGPDFRISSTIYDHTGRKQRSRIALRDKTGTVVRASVGPTFTKCFALFTHLTPSGCFSDVPDGLTHGIADHCHIATRTSHGSTFRSCLRHRSGIL